jgi:hypothetical protein
MAHFARTVVQRIRQLAEDKRLTHIKPARVLAA